MRVLTVVVAVALLDWSSVTVQVTVIVVPPETPEVESVAELEVPLTLPAVAL
jgi:hypothetical protein